MVAIVTVAMVTQVMSQGVIFGVQFSEDCRQVVTVSDDRSIRIWSLPADWEGKRYTNYNNGYLKIVVININFSF